jgi:hypothetical protein
MLDGFLIFVVTTAASAAAGFLMLYVLAWAQKQRRGK